jgi:L-iditol 2-dehydrogenase
MRALVKLKRGIGNIDLIDVEEKKPGPDEVKIRVVAAGICGTDVHTYYDSVPYEPPVIMGHEFSGIIVECGSGVEEFKKGDRVTAESSANTCGHCVYCLEDNINLCPQRKSIGRFVNGSFADYVCLDKKMIHKIPDSLSFTDAALSEPLAVAVHAVKLCSLKTNSIVAVNGPGLIGILTSKLASLKSRNVIVMGLSEDKERLEIAEKFGAGKIIDVKKQDYIKMINELSDGYGAHILFECSGASRGNYDYFNIIRKGGEIIQLGLFKKDLKVDFNCIVFNEYSIKGSFSYNWQDYEDAIGYLSGEDVSADKLSVCKLSLEDWKTGFKYAINKKYLKVMLQP